MITFQIEVRFEKEFSSMNEALDWARKHITKEALDEAIQFEAWEASGDKE